MTWSIITIEVQITSLLLLKKEYKLLPKSLFNFNHVIILIFEQIILHYLFLSLSQLDCISLDIIFELFQSSIQV
jgi:hypothetical protein